MRIDVSPGNTRHWIVFVLSLVAWFLTFWLIITTWPILTSDSQGFNPIWPSLCVIYVVIWILYPPRNRKFWRTGWPGLFRVESHTRSLIRTRIWYSFYIAFGPLIPLVLIRWWWPTALTSGLGQTALNAVVVAVMLWMPIIPTTLAIAGKESVYAPGDRPIGR